MCGILDQARWGQLSQGWRSELGAPGRPPATSSLYTDGDWLAIEELRMLPPAKWEPAESVSWRESLEDWYLDSRDVAEPSQTWSSGLMRASDGRHAGSDVPK